MSHRSFARRKLSRINWLCIALTFFIPALFGSACMGQTGANDPDAAVVPSATVTPLCPIPTSAGVNVCAPAQQSTSNQQVQILAAARGASGAVGHIEIWVDGNKISNVFSNQVNTVISLATGLRRVTLVEVDTAGAFVKSEPQFVNVMATNGCSAPGTAGANVCSPAPGQCFVAGAQIIATATAKSGAVNHMEVWINGRKVSQFSGNQVNVGLNIPLNATSNRLVIVAVDASGNVIDPTPVNFEPC